jgi:hypothetical protein
VGRTAPAVIAVAASLLSVVAAPSAQARTPKELNVCWVNKAPGGVQDLEIVADGPSYRTASLDNGDCLAWDVRPGQYKITVEDIGEYIRAARASCGKMRPALTSTVTRPPGSYRVSGPVGFRHGGLTTEVRKDRRTSVTAMLTCVART